jgi:hypothetical protein
MLPQFVSLPFSIPDVYQGFAEAGGIIKASKAGLILEFEVKDALVGMLKSGINEVQIPTNEISFIDLKAGWFRTRLIIRTRSMATLGNIPGSKPGQIALRIARKDRDIAKRLVSVLMMSMAERELDSLNKEMHQFGDGGVSGPRSLV